MITAGWYHLKENQYFSDRIRGKGLLTWLLALPLMLWLFEYFRHPLFGMPYWIISITPGRFPGFTKYPFIGQTIRGRCPNSLNCFLRVFGIWGGISFENVLLFSGGFDSLVVFSFCRGMEWEVGRGCLALLDLPFLYRDFCLGLYGRFLAFYEITSLFCLWKAWNRPREKGYGFIQLLFS